MMKIQIIKENHLPPKLHNKANTACCSPTLVVNLKDFLLNKCNGMQTKAMHWLWCEVHCKGKDAGALRFLLLISFNF